MDFQLGALEFFSCVVYMFLFMRPNNNMLKMTYQGFKVEKHSDQIDDSNDADAAADNDDGSCPNKVGLKVGLI